MVNHFGPFYLTYLLLDTLSKAKEGRIVNVASLMHDQTKNYVADDVDCSKSWASIDVYSQSKLANVMFTFSLADRFEKSRPNLKAVSLHPGIVDTNFQQASCLFTCMKYVCCCFFQKAENGAMASLHASRMPWADIKSGTYFDTDASIKEPSDASKNREECEKLWKAGEKAFGIKFDV